MDQVAVAPADARRRTSVVVTAAIAIALVVVFIVFAADAQWYTVFKMFHVGAAVIWVGGGIFITICALLLLMIIVFLLDIIFRWVPFFIFCFPIPKLKAKA